MDCAHGVGGAPPELSIYWLCARFPGALPETGSLYDQPAQLMYRMSALDNIYKTVVRYRSAVGANIHRLTNNDRLTLRYLINEGMI